MKKSIKLVTAAATAMMLGGLLAPTVSDAETVYEDSTVSITETTSNSQNFIAPDADLLRSTATGAGGKATLNSGANRRTIYWSVKPKTAGPWLFSGQLKLRYYSGYSRDVNLYGAGVLGSTYSGVEHLNSNHGGKVYLSGHAYAYNGHVYGVLPNFSIAF